MGDDRRSDSRDLLLEPHRPIHISIDGRAVPWSTLRIMHRSVASSRTVPASTPADTRIYAVGDIHGRADLLSEITSRIDDDIRRRPVPHTVEVYLGDYIDRGPHSKEVIDLLAIRLVANHAVCLRGNHEAVMEGFLQEATILPYWLQLGGTETLASYGIELHDDNETALDVHRRFVDAFPRAHELVMQCMRHQFICGDFLFVHAGIRPGIPLDQQDINDLIWIRDEFLDSTRKHERFVVHGHTPVPHPDIRHNRINIDTCAWRTGSLTCMAIEGSTVLFL
ncbi:metallophosphoesterase family protein [Bradyrhizobium sp. BWA-3-5]|uniref:metallophosphoesterase family protein n=1 Tax=Bradyrhizobium sp. BWA-3-5 TaxID=3080013 RepID=UPI00293F5AE7|nr:metallophosphoesterase family protein [Bradyrhizobium sp. BWA-3-5]WOH67157.1 metallophosphoesterase family protein [Bradyrhizobium sp. BWA-3-5]